MATRDEHFMAQAEKEWENSPDLQAEFEDSKEYAHFKLAESQGRVDMKEFDGTYARGRNQ